MLDSALTYEELREQLSDGTLTTCPCCRQKVKPWRAHIYNSMALSLLWLCRRSRENMRSKSGSDAEKLGWVSIRDEGSERADSDTRLTIRSNTITKLKYWGLIEKLPGEVEGTARAGWYRPTRDGFDFAAGRLEVAEWIDVFGDKQLRVSDEYVGIEQCFNKRYADTMREYDPEWDGDFDAFSRRNFPDRLEW